MEENIQRELAERVPEPQKIRVEKEIRLWYTVKQYKFMYRLEDIL